MTIYGNNLYCYHWTSYVTRMSPIVKTLCEAFFACMKHNIPLYEWRLSDSEFDKSKSSFYSFIKKSIVISIKTRHKLLPILLRKIQFYLMFLGHSVYCHPPWSLVVKCVKHLCTCYAKSPMNAKSVYVLPEWPQFICLTGDLKLLRQISNIRLLLKKRHT